MERLKLKSQLGKTKLSMPPIIFGTSCLGNLYQALEDDIKLSIMSEWFDWVEPPVVVDTAGKYGAGLALEVIGKGLKKIGIESDQIVISNKLGWFRAELKTPEPLFEPGVWVGLKHDAIQKINYKGIIECWEQGCEILGGEYKTELVSVHDPDEYLAAVKNDKEKEERFLDIVSAYEALRELRDKGEVTAIGVGAKDWRVIKELTEKIDLDWVMFAVSLTIMNHSQQLLDLIKELTEKKVTIMNSAVFHAGFLTGGNFFNYRKVNLAYEQDKVLFDWREKFFGICNQFHVKPAEACVQFGMSPPGVISVSLNTSKPERVRQNVRLVQTKVPEEFWVTMKEEGLIDRNYPFVG